MPYGFHGIAPHLPGTPVRAEQNQRAALFRYQIIQHVKGGKIVCHLLLPEGWKIQNPTEIMPGHQLQELTIYHRLLPRNAVRIEKDEMAEMFHSTLPQIIKIRGSLRTHPVPPPVCQHQSDGFSLGSRSASGSWSKRLSNQVRRALWILFRLGRRITPPS